MDYQFKGGAQLINNKKIKVLIVLADFYKDISNNLLSGSSEFFKREKVSFDIIRVPGALEIAQTIKFFYETKEIKYDGFLALGCVIKGDTYHFEVVANESARALSNLSIQFSIPIANGILTTYNKSQAIKRSESDMLNKGKESALACLSLIKIKQKLYKIDKKV